ncbi:MAG: Holliday junction branch migration protein RuvA [Bacillota bacterium]|nr:Holliday junction branch migration protein RuvA [Bacillota bacterium]
MISFIRGYLFAYDEDSILLDVNGVGYEIQVHSRAFGSLPSMGEQAMVYTYLQVLDNEMKLYGFMEREELSLFKLLLTVSGIGARGAMNILGSIEPSEFYQAVASGDEKRLLSAPGIGKKTAQRLVFELKDKIGKHTTVSIKSDGGVDRTIEDVLEAMEALGYMRSEVFSVVMELKEHGELTGRVEDNIKTILKRIAAQMKR